MALSWEVDRLSKSGLPPSPNLSPLGRGASCPFSLREKAGMRVETSEFRRYAILTTREVIYAA